MGMVEYCPSPPINIDGFFNIERGTPVTYLVRVSREWAIAVAATGGVSPGSGLR